MIYFVRELLFFLAALTVLFSLGTCAVLLIILAQECAGWSVGKFKEVTQPLILSIGVKTELHLNAYKTAESTAVGKVSGTRQTTSSL